MTTGSTALVPERHDRTFVNVALDRVARACREAAGYDATPSSGDRGGGLPLGEFADAPRHADAGPRRTGRTPAGAAAGRSPGDGTRPGRTAAGGAAGDTWVDAGTSSAAPSAAGASDIAGTSSDGTVAGEGTGTFVRLPQVRAGGDPRPAIATDGSAVLQYPFELRGHGSRVRLAATVEVMTTDGAQVETEAPRGCEPPVVSAWLDPSGTSHGSPELVRGA